MSRFLPSCCLPMLGPFYAFIAALTASIWGLICQQMLRPSSVHQVLGLMSVYYISSLPLVTYRQIRVKGTVNVVKVKHYINLAISVVCAFTSCQFLTLALETGIGLGDVFALGGAYTIPMLAVAFIILKEKPHPVDIVLAFISVIGVFLVARPSFIFEKGVVYNLIKIKGLIFALLKCIFIAIRIAIDKNIGTTFNEYDILLYTGAFGVFSSGVLIKAAKIGNFVPCFTDFLLLIVASLCGFIGRVTLIKSTKTEQANHAVVIYSTQVFIAYILEALVTQILPNYIAVIGGTLIVISSVGSILLKIWLQKKEKLLITK